MKSNIQKRKRAMFYYKKKYLPSIRKLTLKQRKLSTMRVNLVHHPGLAPSHKSSMVFSLNKAEFRDAIMLRYGKEFKGFPATCPCGQKYDTTHVLNCKKGGFVTIRHNSIRDYETNLLVKIHTDVETEPSLQPIEGEIVDGIPGDNSRPDARGDGESVKTRFFDVRITNTNSTSQHNVKTEKILLRHEKEKK